MARTCMPNNIDENFGTFSEKNLVNKLGVGFLLQNILNAANEL